MANKTRGGGGKPGKSGKPVAEDSNVISLFGTDKGPLLTVDGTPNDSEDEALSRKLMIESLNNLIASIEAGETTGIIAIGMRTNGEYGAETYMGGSGVFGQMDRAVGIMEMVKHDLVLQAKKEEL